MKLILVLVVFGILFASNAMAEYDAGKNLRRPVKSSKKGRLLYEFLNKGVTTRSFCP